MKYFTFAIICFTAAPVWALGLLTTPSERMVATEATCTRDVCLDLPSEAPEKTPLVSELQAKASPSMLLLMDISAKDEDLEAWQGSLSAEWQKIDLHKESLQFYAKLRKSQEYFELLQQSRRSQLAEILVGIASKPKKNDKNN